TFQQIGTTEKRSIRWSRATDDDVISTSSSGVPAIEHELLRCQAGTTGKIVERCRILDKFPPVDGGLHVHFNHSRIRRDFNIAQSPIVWRRISFDNDGQLQERSGVLHCSNELDVVFRHFYRRKEHTKAAVARLDGERRTNHISR